MEEHPQTGRAASHTGQPHPRSTVGLVLGVEAVVGVDPAVFPPSPAPRGGSQGAVPSGICTRAEGPGAGLWMAGATPCGVRGVWGLNSQYPGGFFYSICALPA